MKKPILLCASILGFFLFLPIMAEAADYNKVTIITPRFSIMPITSDCHFLGSSANEKMYTWPKPGSSAKECTLNVTFDRGKLNCEIRVFTQQEPSLSSCPTASLNISGSEVRVTFK